MFERMYCPGNSPAKLILLSIIAALTIAFAEDKLTEITQDGGPLKKSLEGFFVLSGKDGRQNPEIKSAIGFLKAYHGYNMTEIKTLKDGQIFPEFEISREPSGKFSIGITPDLLRSLESDPAGGYVSLIYLASCLKEYVAALKSPDGLEAEDYPKEIARQMKSCALQVLFIKEYRIKNKAALTLYEKALLESARDNNMYDFMFKYYRLDAEWLDYLAEVLGAESTAKGKLKQLNDIGLKKIEESVYKLKKENSKEDIYYALVMPVMYCKLVPYFVYDITVKNKEKKPFKSFKYDEAAPELAKTAEKLKSLITPFLESLDYSKMLAEGLKAGKR